MKRHLTLLALLGMSVVNHAANIVWVSDNGAEANAPAGVFYPPVSAGTPYTDQPFVDLLINAGHSVTRYNPNSSGFQNSQVDIPTLNSYDLIILGSALNSGPFNLLARGNYWNTAITKPMIITKSTLIKSDRMGYLRSNVEYDCGADQSTTASGKFTLPIPTHPIFNGIGHTSIGGSEVMNNFGIVRVANPPNNRGTSVEFFDLIVNGVPNLAANIVNNVIEPGGSVLATIDFNPMNPGVNIAAGILPTVDPTYQAIGYAIAEWPRGTVVRTTQVADTLASYRLLFACGTRDASGTATGAPNPLVGAMDLTPDGQQMFLNAVTHATNQHYNWTNASTDSQWNDTSANWTFGLWPSGGDAFFGSVGAGTVTLTTPITARNLTVNSANYVFGATGGSTLTLAGGFPTVTANSNTTLSVSIAGAEGLTVKGSSNLTLAGVNSYTSGTYVTGGTLILHTPVGAQPNTTQTQNGAPSTYAVDSIETVEAGATVKFFSDAPIMPLTNNSLVRADNGQIGYQKRLVLNGGTLDLNGDDNRNQVPAVEGFGVVTNSSPYARAVLKMGALAGTTHAFGGIIQNGNGGVVTNSIVPNNAGATTYKQGYRMDIDMQSFQDNSTVLVLAGQNTYTGTTRIGGGRLLFVGSGRWGVPVNTGDSNTSTPNGTIICNGGANDLRVDFNGTSQVTGGLSGNGGVYANNAPGTFSTLTVGAANISNTVWPTGGSGQNGRIVDNATITGGTISAVNVVGGGQVALTKVGTGTIGFPTAGHSYSGPTTVYDGVLEFTATGAPSPNSTVQVFSPGALKLSHTGAKTVNAFYVNGVKQPNNTTFNATTHPTVISGPGEITTSETHGEIPHSLEIVNLGAEAALVWSGFGVLQQSADLITWTDVLSATSPYVAQLTPSKQFFRLRF